MSVDLRLDGVTWKRKTNDTLMMGITKYGTPAKAREDSYGSPSIDTNPQSRCPHTSLKNVENGWDGLESFRWLHNDYSSGHVLSVGRSVSGCNACSLVLPKMRPESQSSLSSLKMICEIML